VIWKALEKIYVLGVVAGEEVLSADFCCLTMGGYPLQNALEGSPLGSARVGVAIAVTLLVGQSVGIDASVLLYKLVVGSLQMLRECRQRRFALVTDAFVNRMLRLVEAGVTPVVVFDGAARYPPKGATHASRAAARLAAEARLAAGGLSVAEETRALANAFAPTRELVSHVFAALQGLGVAAFVAPMEADAQLAFLDRFGFVGYTMSVDNDLIALGCRRVIFEWDWQTLTGRAFALASVRCVPGTFTEVFATDSGGRCAFGDMLPVMQLFAALAGCDYSKFEGVGASKAASALRDQPVRARLRARDYAGAAKLAVLWLQRDLGHALRVPGGENLTLEAAQMIVLRATDAFVHAPAFSSFAERVVPLSLVDAPPAHLGLDFGAGLVGLNADPVAAFTGGGGAALLEHLLENAGDAYVEVLVPRMVLNGDWTAWQLRRADLVGGKPHGVRLYEVTPSVLSHVPPELLKYYLRIRQIVVGGSSAELQQRVHSQITLEATQLVPTPIATDPDASADGDVLRSVRLNAGALPEDLVRTESVEMPSDEGQWRLVTWDTAGVDGRAAFMQGFPLVRPETILAYFRERSFVRMKAIRAGAYRCRLMRTLDGAHLTWASPRTSTATRRTHCVQMDVGASYGRLAYTTTLRIDVEHPNFAAVELPERIAAFPSVLSIVHGSCTCAAGRGRCLHGSVLAHVLLNLPRPRSTVEAPAPPEAPASSTAGPCLWRLPGASAASAAAARRVALVQTMTVPIPPSGIAQARHDSRIAQAGGRAAFLGVAAPRAARAIAARVATRAMSSVAERARDRFLLRRRSPLGPSAFEVTWASEPADVRAWLAAVSMPRPQSASAEAGQARADAIAAALDELGAAKRRRLRRDAFADARAVARAAGAETDAAVEAAVLVAHGAALLPTPAPTAPPPRAAPPSSSSSSAGASRYRPWLRHHPFAAIPAPGVRVASRTSMHQFLCGWCGYVQDAARHWPQLPRAEGAAAGADAPAAANAGAEEAHAAEVPQCVARTDARMERRALRFEADYFWPAPGASFASANPLRGRGRKRRADDAFGVLLAAAAM
jgi:5'-3' exonuclease